MPTEVFTRQQFEEALPRDKHTQDRLWYSLGLVEGEYCYIIPVKEDVDIYLRSSVHGNGTAGGTGEDSIRAWLSDPVTRKPIIDKSVLPQRWVARTKNWRVNMLNVLRYLDQVGQYLGHCPADNCQLDRKLFKVKKQDASKPIGTLFSSCKCGKYFEWVEIQDS